MKHAFRTKEIAGRAGFPSESALTKARTGHKRLDVPAHHRDGGKVIYTRASLRAWLERHGRDPAAVEDL